jgi:hypothetical protein
MSRSGRVLLALVFAAYCAATIAGAAAHEPWWDEAQAWLVARDAPPAELFTHHIRYEGHPPLWFLVLAVPAKLGLPYASLQVAALLGGATSAFLLLFAFPRVPLYVRVLAPFALFVAYQYTVVARSYVLLLPLLLLIARMWERRSGGRFAALLILLSHVSVHGFAIACGLALLSLRRRAHVLAFVLNAALLVALLWPPPDLMTAVNLHSPLDPQRHAAVVSSLVPSLFWTELQDEPPVQAVAKVAAALLALTILVFWMFRSGAGLPFALATLAAYAVALRYLAVWHEGIFFFLLVFGAVLAFERSKRGPLDTAARIVLVLLLLRHAEWTVRSLAYDLRRDSTGSARAARFLREQGLDRRQLYGAGVAVVEVQPYFEANILDNSRTAFWEYSTRRNTWPYMPAAPDAMTQWIDGVLAARPEYILYGTGLLSQDEYYAPDLFRSPAYVRMASFGGVTFWKDRPARRITFHVFRRADRPPASAPRSGAR